jgi:hypothetical protein
MRATVRDCLGSPILNLENPSYLVTALEGSKRWYECDETCLNPESLARLTPAVRWVAINFGDDMIFFFLLKQ